MAKPKESPKRGCMARALFWICSASSLLLALALVFMVLPQDLSDLEGYAESIQTEKPRDLTAVLRESVKRGHKLTLSEEELNRWVGQTLTIRQQGMLAKQVKLLRLGIRLQPERVELIMERHLFGLKMTQSMYLQVQVETDANSSSKEVLLHGGPMLRFVPLLKKGGRFGRMAVPQGYLYLVKPAFFQLGEVYKEELHLIFRKMQEIHIKEGRVVLVPRPAPAPPMSP